MKEMNNFNNLTPEKAKEFILSEVQGQQSRHKMDIKVEADNNVLLDISNIPIYSFDFIKHALRSKASEKAEVIKIVVRLRLEDLVNSSERITLLESNYRYKIPTSVLDIVVNNLQEIRVAKFEKNF